MRPRADAALPFGITTIWCCDCWEGKKLGRIHGVYFEFTRELSDWKRMRRKAISGIPTIGEPNEGGGPRHIRTALNQRKLDSTTAIVAGPCAGPRTRNLNRGYGFESRRSAIAIARLTATVREY